MNDGRKEGTGPMLWTPGGPLGFGNLDADSGSRGLLWHTRTEVCFVTLLLSKLGFLAVTSWSFL